MKQLGPIEQTQRGFEVVAFDDHYGAACTLQQSSLAVYEKPGSSAVWLGCEKNTEPHHVTGDALSPRMHLTRDQVSALVAHLTKWLAHGSFEVVLQREGGD